MFCVFEETHDILLTVIETIKRVNEFLELTLDTVNSFIKSLAYPNTPVIHTRAESHTEYRC